MSSIEARGPEQIRNSIEETRRELAFSVNDLRSKVSELTDWRRQLTENRDKALVEGQLARPEDAPRGTGIAMIGRHRVQ